ncbi:MAG: hypothetical protein EOO10_06515 [Chitinophagaceae bacterium]|nr:MAG: hypothetical protein EOO10_06515 [Chitinophagaceae bacterium]
MNLFQLLQPIWPWAITGIIVPVLIHLWNVREGKTLKVGSISLLQETARQHARSLKLKDLLLLLLRCLLIIVLAFLLAKPVWKEQLFSGSEKGWVLIEKERIKTAYQQHKNKIDSLKNAGFKFHYLSEGFPADDWELALEQPIDSSANPNTPYWTLLKNLNELVPTDLPVFLFTSNELKRFTGPRPAVAMNLYWFIYSLPDTVVKKPLVVHKSSADKLRVAIGNSTANGTFYTKEGIEERSLADGIALDTAAIDVAIYADQFATDAMYLRAAINAIEQTAKIKINTVSIKGDDEINQNMDWLFWLSEKPLPQVTPPNVFVYEKGKDETLTSFIHSSEASLVNSEPVSLLRSNSQTSKANRKAIWNDGFGNVLLGVSSGKQMIYHFASRFNPAWNDLSWNGNFVNMVYDLLITKNQSFKNFDKRTIDVKQMMPVLQRQKDFDKQKFIQATDLSKAFWMVAFLLFCLERYLSLTRKNEVYG